MTDEAKNLVVLAAVLGMTKRKEAELKEQRLDLEARIIAITGFTKPEGQETYKRDSELGSCTITLKQPINTKVDSDKWEALRRTLDPKHPGRACFRRKYDVETKNARELQDGDDDAKKAWAEVSEVVTRSPGKVSVEVTRLEMNTPIDDADIKAAKGEPDGD